jgi:hypothetical protein
MKTKNISINVDGHKFKLWPGTTSKHCESCGIGYETYLNLGPKCRNFIDKRALYHQVLDKYLDAGGDPEFVIISQKDLTNLMEAK